MESSWASYFDHIKPQYFIGLRVESHRENIPEHQLRDCEREVAKSALAKAADDAVGLLVCVCGRQAKDK